MFGKPTTSKGTVIDYFIGSPALLKYVSNMYVCDYDPMLSDIHNMVVLELSGKTTVNGVNEHVSLKKGRVKSGNKNMQICIELI